MNPFLSTLFNLTEGICVGSTGRETAVQSVANLGNPEAYNFFCINPLLITIDKNPTESWHSPYVGRRADCNVTEYRNFLLEIDTLPLDEQKAVLLDCPISTLVYSGGKSMHAIISLETPLTSKQEYKNVFARIAKKVPQIDIANSNPSRFSRMANSYRTSNNVLQVLYVCGKRISKETFEAWLGPDTEKKLISEQPLKKINLQKNTQHFLTFGADAGHWNVALFNSACDMSRCHWTEERIQKAVCKINGELDAADKKTISSAIRTVATQE
jgi:hypothetical protein